MFCIGGISNDPFTVSFKVKAEEFDEMTAREGIIPAPYLARAKWVFIEYPEALSQDEWKNYIKQAYDLIKSKLPKRVQKELD